MTEKAKVEVKLSDQFKLQYIIKREEFENPISRNPLWVHIALNFKETGSILWVTLISLIYYYCFSHDNVPFKNTL